MNIVFLNLAVMPYHVIVFKALIDIGYRCIVYWYGTAPKTAYRAPDIDGLTLFNRFEFRSSEALYKHCSQFSPRVVVAAGWSDKGYNDICARMRKNDVVTLASSDTQWRGGKQWLNRLLSLWRHRKYFDYIWAAGILQFDYARKLGFPAKRILMNCFGADVETFSKISIDAKQDEYPRKFLYVGRFVEVKAIDILLNAWREIKNKRGWTLELIGEGPLKEWVRTNFPDVIVKDFMSQELLAKEAEHSGCFVIPSRFEPWALVIQEFAAAGLPIIATRQCGATRHFVLNGYNGYVVDADDVHDLASAMERIMDQDLSCLIKMGQRSRELAMQATPKFCAHTLLSILN